MSLELNGMKENREMNNMKSVEHSEKKRAKVEWEGMGIVEIDWIFSLDTSKTINRKKRGRPQTRPLAR